MNIPKTCTKTYIRIEANTTHTHEKIDARLNITRLKFYYFNKDTGSRVRCLGVSLYVWFLQKPRNQHSRVTTIVVLRDYSVGKNGPFISSVLYGARLHPRPSNVREFRRRFASSPLDVLRLCFRRDEGTSTAFEVHSYRWFTFVSVAFEDIMCFLQLIRPQAVPFFQTTFTAKVRNNSNTYRSNTRTCIKITHIVWNTV